MALLVLHTNCSDVLKYLQPTKKPLLTFQTSPQYVDKLPPNTHTHRHTQTSLYCHLLGDLYRLPCLWFQTVAQHSNKSNTNEGLINADDTVWDSVITFEVFHRVLPQPETWQGIIFRHLKVNRDSRWQQKVYYTFRSFLFFFIGLLCSVEPVIRRQSAVRVRNEGTPIWAWRDSCRLKEISSIFND